MNKLVVTLTVACVLPLALATCDSDAPQAPTPTVGISTPSFTATLSSSTSQLRTPIPPPTPEGNWLATVLPTWTPDSPGATPVPGVLRLPSSGRVKPGQTYIISIYTHCGLDWNVDFDGSFWDAAGPVRGTDGNAPPGVGNPSQLGTMTLIDADLAHFAFPPVTYTGLDNRQTTLPGGSFDFTRHIGPKYVLGCY